MSISLGQRIQVARKAKGWTQEELAERTHLTIRTIQRLENNETAPRLHTLRILATTLDLPLDTLYPTVGGPSDASLPAGLPDTQTDERAFLHVLNLTTFTYLLIPWGHFMLLYYLFKRQAWQHRRYRAFGWQIVKTQIWWNVATTGLMLVTLLYNLLQATYRPHPVFISYFVPFVGMYLFNGWLIYCVERKLEAAPLTPVAPK